MRCSRMRERNEVLVAILNDPAAFDLVQNQGWHRVPVDTAPKRWPPDVPAFYQTKVFTVLPIDSEG